jgi:hypothetical protein
MGSFHAAVGICAASLLTALAATAQAAPTYTQLGNDGTVRVTTYTPTLTVTSSTLANPYGPLPPVISVVPNGWALTYTLNPAFIATTTNAAGGRSESVLAKLDFTITFDAPIQLTANIVEGGTYNETGPGEVSVFGGAVVTAEGGAEQRGSGLLGTNAVFGAGIWSSSAQVTGFAGQYATYRFSVDNDLLAYAPTSLVAGTASIKKDSFTIIITNNVPEPASLGVLAVGAMGLLVRRRR